MSTYKIKSGNHNSEGINFGIHFSNSTVYKNVTFSESCKYNLGNVNQFDINKLYGFSIGLFKPNSFNSARFGWRWNIDKQKIELFAYIYVNGIRVGQGCVDEDKIFLSDVNINQNVYTQISVIDNQYKFSVVENNNTVHKYFQRSGNGAGYNQYPYFGGDEVAPHDIIIQLD